VRITPEALRAACQHAERDYPGEACGLLAGRGGLVCAAIPALNAVVGPVGDRHELVPAEHELLRRLCRLAGLDVLGYYHSHPDRDAQPSRTDSQHAWAGAAYLIVSVQGGRVAGAMSCATQRDGGPLEEAPFVLELEAK
jgi:proteasome lid subunit RPN8/RPN11